MTNKEKFINVFKQEPTTKNDDCISRTNLYNKIKGIDHYEESEGSEYDGTLITYNTCDWNEVLREIEDAPSVTPQPCEDVISRQALLNATVHKNSIWNKITDSEGNNLETIISKLPSMTPQEPFMATPCISSKVCEHDRMVTLDKIKAEIEELDYITFDGITKRKCLEIIEKYKAESEK